MNSCFIYNSNISTSNFVSGVFLSSYSRLSPLLEITSYISRSFRISAIDASRVLYFDFYTSIRRRVSCYWCYGNKYVNLSKIVCFCFIHERRSAIIRASCHFIPTPNLCTRQLFNPWQKFYGPRPKFWGFTPPKPHQHSTYAIFWTHATTLWTHSIHLTRAKIW